VRLGRGSRWVIRRLEISCQKEISFVADRSRTTALGDHLPHAGLEPSSSTSLSRSTSSLSLSPKPDLCLDLDPIQRVPSFSLSYRAHLLLFAAFRTFTRVQHGLRVRIRIYRQRVLDQRVGRRGQECGIALSSEKRGAHDRYRRSGGGERLRQEGPDRYVTSGRVRFVSPLSTSVLKQRRKS
jgi:hypothetical protein